MKTMIKTSCVVLGILSLASCTTTSGEQNTTLSKDNMVVYSAGSQEPRQAPKSQTAFQKDAQGKDPVKKMKALLALGQWKTAIAEAEAFLRNNPSSPQALETLALGYSLNKDFERGAYYAKQLLRTNEQDAVALNILGMREVLSSGYGYGKFRAALALFERSFALGHQAAGLNLGETYLITGAADKALPIYSQIVDACSNCIDANIGQGIAANRLQQYDLAKSSFEKALSLDENNEKARYHLALVERNGFNNLPAAEKHLEMLLASSHMPAAKERAQALLRQIKGEAPVSTRIAANKKQEKSKATTQEVEASQDKNIDEANFLLIEAEKE